MRIPCATYRLQFNSSFTFSMADGIVKYLFGLGISDVYASPIFKARKGSPHGYDVVDPNQLNSELGTIDDFEKLITKLKRHDMGWIQDLVPNHMAYDSENQILVDVLENGTNSAYFHFFDIEWDHPYESLRGGILAPFLGKFYGESLEDGEIQLQYNEIGLYVYYYSLRFPLKIESYVTVFSYRLDELKKKLGEEHPDFQKFLGVLSILKIIPSKEEVSERSEQIKFIKNMLWELYTTNDEIKKYIDENVKSFNGQKGNPESFNILDSLLSEQFFRLSFWKVATEEINYRRFFNINDLISLKVENEDVFHHTHHLIFKLIEERRISGLRIDHIDGLYDPVNYLRRVREKAKDIYIVVEKILDQDEEIPSFWPIQGTTGYESLDFINGIHSKGESEREFTKIYSRFIAFKTPHREILSEKKRLITGKHMAGDIDNLAQLAKRISSKDRYGGDITLYGLKRAFVEVMTFFPVYRTYINHEIFSEMDQSYIKKAIGEATRANPGLLYELNFIERFLLLKFDAYLTLEDQRQWLHFVMRFQQFTGPLMAKGFEDTFLYVYNRLISLNEVGGSPHRFGISLEAFSSFNEKRAHCLPHSMNATSTHDTKRGEDVRARINVLSELPEEWRNHIKLWSRINRKKKKSINGVTVPERNDEYFLYQTLIGTFPFSDDAYPSYVERIKDYIIKAVREAKVHTAWLKPDTEYEHAFLSFIEDILDSQGINRFLKEFIPFQKKVAFYGVFNSLTQTLLKMTIPGVPDFYQGTELWDLNLVDPDNRRPVDFEKRKVFLKDIKEKAHTDLLGLISELLSAREDGRIKLFLIYKVLNVRKEMSKVFQKGAYIPIQSDGKHKDHVVVFARNYRNTWVLVIAPRFLTSLISEGEYPHGINVWYDTYINLPEGAPLLWKDVFSGQVTQCEGTLLVGEVLNYFSVTVLVGNVKSSMKKEKKI